MIPHRAPLPSLTFSRFGQGLNRVFSQCLREALHRSQRYICQLCNFGVTLPLLPQLLHHENFAQCACHGQVGFFYFFTPNFLPATVGRGEAEEILAVQWVIPLLCSVSLFLCTVEHTILLAQELTVIIKSAPFSCSF